MSVNAVCRTIETYYGPGGSRRLHDGVLVVGDAGPTMSTDTVAVYVDGVPVSHVVAVFRSIGECGRAHGWVVAYRTDDAGKVIVGDGGVYALDFITGNVEALLDAEHPFPSRIDE